MIDYKFVTGDLSDYEFWRWSALEQCNLESCVPCDRFEEWVPMVQDRDRLLDDVRD